MIAIFFVGMLMISSIVALVISEFNRKSDLLIKIKELIFFYGLTRSIMSAIKILIGEGEWILWQSFDRIYPITWIRYGIVTFGGAIFFAIIFRLINDNKRIFIDKFISKYVCIFMIWVVILGAHISNIDFLCIFVAAFVMALAQIILCHKNDGLSKKWSSKEKAFFIIAILFEYCMTVTMYIPSTLFINNLGEFEIPFYSVFAILVLTSILIIVLMGGMLFVFAEERDLVVTGVISFGLITVGYIQNNFLNGKLKMMDGNMQEWSIGSKLVNCLIWVGLLACIFILTYKKEKIGKKVISYGATYIGLMQLVALIVLMFTNPIEDKVNSNAFLSTDGITEVSDGNNILVFVLDCFDEQVLEKIVADRPEIMDEYKDFTWYQNATSKYAYTYMSIPYLLTGTEWEYDMLPDEYTEYAFSNSQFLDDVKNGSYSIDIYSSLLHIGTKAHHLIDNVESDKKINCEFYETINFMENCSRYNMSPFVLKHYFTYATSDVNRIIKNDNIYRTLEDVSFYRYMRENPVSVVKNEESVGAFKFYHLYGDHPPYIMNESIELGYDVTLEQQAYGCMKLVSEYIQQLKKKGVYEDATILITADHGQNFYIGDAEKAHQNGYNPTSNPIFLLKKRGEAKYDSIRISDKAISHEELIPTVMEQMGLDYHKYGNTIDEIPDNQDRDFTIRFYPDKPLSRYIIDGDVRDFENWKLKEQK